MTDQPDNTYSPEVVASYVWDAIKDLPGIADLYRNPLQAFGEKVHLERRGPVRLEQNEARRAVEIHLVIRPDARLATLVPDIQRHVVTYLEGMTGIHFDDVHVHVDDIDWEEPQEA